MYIQYLSCDVDSSNFSKPSPIQSVGDDFQISHLATVVDVRFFVIMLFLMMYEPYKTEDTLDYSSILDKVKQIYPEREIPNSCNFVSLSFLILFYEQITFIHSNIAREKTPNIQTDPPSSITISFFSLSLFSIMISQLTPSIR